MEKPTLPAPDSTPITPITQIVTPQPPSEPSLHRTKHLKYWLRSLKSPLPNPYTSTDLSRLSLAFFSLSALDLLDEIHTSTTAQERKDWIDWIYLCQLPTGGFRGSPATTGTGEIWDVANLPACYFALVGLNILGDDLSRVNWTGLGKFLVKVQREDGGFGEWILKGGVEGEGDRIMGGEDMRYMYCAMAVRWIMHGGYIQGKDGPKKKHLEGVRDVDVDGCVRFIKASTTYDCGFAAFPFIEAHAGHAYCALSALSLLGRLHDGVPPARTPAILRWLVSMQVPYAPEPDSDQEQDSKENSAKTPNPNPNPATPSALPGDAAPVYPVPGQEGYINGHLTGGFCGRINKRGDTCYSFWVGGALDVLGHADLMEKDANRRFLLGETQHLIGGFGKLPGVEYRPDILHSYLGLAALSIMGEPGLKKIDPALCISVDTKERIMRMPWLKDVEGVEVR